jgi:cell fate regulator YaaT (PSP1 superfamily)
MSTGILTILRNVVGYFYGSGPYVRLSEAANEGRLPSVQRHILYFVLFKCFRGGVYYVVEGTGLHLKAGDMVIVEGDRGIDIGTVQHCDISPAEAKNLMIKAQTEHFRWLMMFSRTVQTNPQVRWAVSNSVDPQQAAARHPSHFHHGEDTKPKLIKRLAQAHEVQTLKDKEGQEAKAKRLCQQKVVEHGLQMEILDAELQM